MSLLEVEDREFQKILLASYSDAQGPGDDAALARMLQQQEDALHKAPARPHQFGNAGTPNDPINISPDEDEELMKALEESLKPHTPLSSTTPVITSEKNAIPQTTTSTTQLQHISSTHPSTPSTQPQTTLISPRAASSSMDGLTSLLGRMNISPEREKNNKPVNPTITSTTSSTQPTNNMGGMSGNSGDVGSNRNITTNSRNIAYSTTTDANGSTRKIIKPKRRNPDNKQPAVATPALHSASQSNNLHNTHNNIPNTYSNTTNTYSNTYNFNNHYNTSYNDTPSNTHPQPSVPPPRANSNNPSSRSYRTTTTFYTSPTNNSINIAADLSAPYSPSPSTTTNTLTITSPSSISPPPSNTPNISNTTNMYNSYSDNFLQRQRSLPNNSQRAAYIPPNSRLLNPSSTAPPPTSATSSPSPSAATTFTSSSSSSSSSTSFSSSTQHRQPSAQPGLPRSNSAGNAGNTRTPAYVSFVNRLGGATTTPSMLSFFGPATTTPTSASTPTPTPASNPATPSIDDDEAFAQSLQLQEAMQLQQEYDQANLRPARGDDSVAQLLRLQAMLENRQGGSWYAGGDSGSEYSDDEYDENDVDHMTYEQLLALEDRIGHVPRGASKNEIDLCPKFTLSPDRALENKTCLVCHDEMIAGNEIRRLPCLHMYHVSCIDTWLSQKPTCPVCLHTIKKD